ncbi:hypothetical protein [Methylobacterium sp. PvR107]|uniref:hypothetical protein n=1 Tax=Methylobacterium sp. PvR107 TaxID=2806597 RepID=UPI001AE668B4|nr:hypothetical protein [Methylobacterium sp. PvR107]MBP1179952.1 hypothetical protein [Methylobacterium sp. PvR107]
MISALSDYISAVWQHWTLILTGGPLLAERICKQFWTGYEAYIRKLISNRLRLAFGIVLAIAGFIYANFQAFNDQRDLLVAAQNKLQLLSIKAAPPYAKMSQNDLDVIRTNFEKLNPRPTAFVSFVTGDISISALANQFADSFKSAGLKVYMGMAWVDSEDDRGLYLTIRNHKNPNVKDAAIINAFRASGVEFQMDELPNDAGFDGVDFSLIIAPHGQKH